MTRPDLLQRAAEARHKYETMFRETKGNSNSFSVEYYKGIYRPMENDTLRWVISNCEWLIDCLKLGIHD